MSDLCTEAARGQCCDGGTYKTVKEHRGRAAVHPGGYWTKKHLTSTWYWNRALKNKWNLQNGGVVEKDSKTGNGMLLEF